MNKFLILFIALILQVQILPQTSIDRQIQVGLDKMYNFNWEAGFEAFNSVINKHPDDPRGYHYKSVIYLWFYLGNLREDNLDSFYQYSDKAIELTENKIKENPSAELSYLLGSVYYNKSIAEARNGNFLQALWTSSQMKTNLEDALKIKPDFYDAFLGLGLYNFALSQIPSSLEWAANLVGINADKEKGLTLVLKSVQKGKLSRVDAQYYLSQLYSRVIVNHPEAKNILSDLVRRYPKNLLFNFSLAWVEYELLELNNAEKHLRKVLNAKDELYPYISSNSNLLLANIFFDRNQFDSARVYYESFLKNAVNNDFKGFANYRVGLSLELSGKRNDALKFYKLSDTGNTDIEEDLYAERKGNELKDSVLTEPEERLILISSLYQQNKLNAARDSLINYLKSPDIEDELKAEAKLFLAKVFYQQKKYKESLNAAVDCLKTEIKKENWIHAFAHYFAAWNSYQLKNYTDSKLFLLQIKEISEFDFRSSLENKIYTLERLLPQDTRNN
ncbi:MAG: DUF3808 domain-containing protein [Ignavibacteriaceae bacterium]|jgi:predicted negative regulator of RcsB-dependent stress response|nr:DUF3808 domain-containing protein [Ignavibacteriaceae bacterium]